VDAGVIGAAALAYDLLAPPPATGEASLAATPSRDAGG
jgi:hypothetical protein